MAYDDQLVSAPNPLISNCYNVEKMLMMAEEETQLSPRAFKLLWWKESKADML